MYSKDSENLKRNNTALKDYAGRPVAIGMRIGQTNVSQKNMNGDMAILMNEPMI